MALAGRDITSEVAKEAGVLAREDGMKEIRLLARDPAGEDAARDGARELKGVKSWCRPR
jgi:hypothetical protein